MATRRVSPSVGLYINELTCPQYGGNTFFQIKYSKYDVDGSTVARHCRNATVRLCYTTKAPQMMLYT